MLEKLLKTFEYFHAFFSILQNLLTWKTFQNLQLKSVTQDTHIFQIFQIQVILRSNFQQEEQEQNPIFQSC